MRIIKIGRLKPVGIILLIIGLLILTNSCNNLKKMCPDKTTFEIHFGKSGGFTNMQMEYKMCENGNIIKIQNDVSQKINTIKKNKINTIKNLLLDSDFEHLKIIEPGNITYFITVKTDKFKNTVKWNDLIINDSLKNLYKELLMTIKP